MSDPTVYGVTSTGFVVKPMQAILDDLNAAFRAAFGDNINLEPQSWIGQVVGIVAERQALLWQAAADVYKSQYPDSASDASLVNIASITGTLQKGPVASTVDNVVLIGTNGTVVTAASAASVQGSGTRFDSDADATIATLTAWSTTTFYALGDLRQNGGNVYRCAQAGESAFSGTGPAGTGAEIPDNGTVWEYCGPGTAAVYANFTAEKTGALIAPAGTLTVIETPIAGWSSVFNPLDATIGQDIETDPALRIRREKELRGQGTAPADAIRARLLRTLSVTAASVTENDTDSTDGNGLPPHSVECVVQGGADSDVAATIFASKGAGIQTHGTTTVAVVDSQGISHNVSFSRPSTVDIWIVVNVTKASTGWPADGAAQIADALAAYGQANLEGGDDLITSRLYPVIESVSGIYDVVSIFVGTAPAPVTSANVVISLRQIALIDTSRITVNAS